jgi:hypothetical protein
MYILDLVPPQELIGYIRGLAYELNMNRFVLSQYLPDETIDDVEFRITRGNLIDEDSATYRSWDTESPIAKRLAGTRISGTIPPISRKIRLGEEARLRLNAQRGGDVSQLIAAVYDDAAKMTRAVLARLERARGEVLSTGSLAIAENGVAGTVGWSIPGTHLVAPGTLWSDLAASDPIADLRDWQQTYLLDTGVLPKFALISTAIAANLLRNAKVRTLASSIAGAPSLVSPVALNQVLDSFGLPQLVTYDTRVRVDGVSTRVIANNKLIFLPPPEEPLGSTLHGVTAEALDLVSAGVLDVRQQAGLTVVIDKDTDPVATWTKAVDHGLPAIANPELLLVATVQ